MPELIDELIAALECMIEDLDNNGEVFGSDVARIEFMQKTITHAKKKKGQINDQSQAKPTTSSRRD